MMDIRNIRTRWMIAADLPDVIGIDYSISDNEASWWHESDFAKLKWQRNTVERVAVFDETVVGFEVHLLYPSQKAIEIARLVVRVDLFRMGVGTRLINDLKDKIRDRYTSLVTAQRDTNVDAHLFLKAQGFLATEVIRGGFADTGEDSYLFRFAKSEEMAMPAFLKKEVNQ